MMFAMLAEADVVAKMKLANGHFSHTLRMTSILFQLINIAFFALSHLDYTLNYFIRFIGTI